MSSSVGNAALRTHANGLRTSLDDISPKAARVRTVAKTVENAPEPRKSAAIAREAMRRTDTSQKAFAIGAKQPESVISEGLNGQRNLAFDWIDAQEDAFVLTFVDVWLASRNLTPQNQRAARLKLAATLFQQLVDLVEE